MLGSPTSQNHKSKIQNLAPGRPALSKIRFPLLALGLLALLSAAWAGLIRLGWGWPALQPALPAGHGPLIVSGFLGTVIGLERAVALTAWPGKRRHDWTYLGPVLSGLGGLALILGLPQPVGPLLITLASLNLVLVFGVILRMQPAAFTVTMGLGALLWLIGNGLWLFGRPVSTAVYWWSGFLILTIAGERLELNRVLRLPGRVQILFFGTVALFLAGLFLSPVKFDLGVRVAGVGMLALAIWLLRYDIARYTVRKTGLTRFMAFCLLVGYVWLGIGGLLGIYYGGVSGGPLYDAGLHAVFIGFVLSMIFAHAPIIFPAVIGRPIPFLPVFYLHLILLHLSLGLRVGSDIAWWLPGRQWGGLLNVVAVLLFLFNTGRALRRGRLDRPAPPQIVPQ